MTIDFFFFVLVYSLYEETKPQFSNPCHSSFAISFQKNIFLLKRDEKINLSIFKSSKMYNQKLKLLSPTQKKTALETRLSMCCWREMLGYSF